MGTMTLGCDRCGWKAPTVRSEALQNPARRWVINLCLRYLFWAHHCEEKN